MQLLDDPVAADNRWVGQVGVVFFVEVGNWDFASGVAHNNIGEAHGRRSDPIIGVMLAVKDGVAAGAGNFVQFGQINIALLGDFGDWLTQNANR